MDNKNYPNTTGATEMASYHNAQPSMSQTAPPPIYSNNAAPAQSHPGPGQPSQYQGLEPVHQPSQPDVVYSSQPINPYGGVQSDTLKHGVRASNFANAVPLSSLSELPAPVDCPNCHQRCMTSTNYEAGNTTHAWACVLCLFTLLCCIPYCISSTKDVDHRCGNCGARLANWHRSGRTEVYYH